MKVTGVLLLALAVLFVAGLIAIDNKAETQPGIDHAAQCEKAGGVPVSTSLYAAHPHMICVRQDALIPIQGKADEASDLGSGHH